MRKTIESKNFSCVLIRHSLRDYTVSISRGKKYVNMIADTLDMSELEVSGTEIGRYGAAIHMTAPRIMNAGRVAQLVAVASTRHTGDLGAKVSGARSKETTAAG